MNVLDFLWVYLLGGVTFLPAVVVVLFFLRPKVNIRRSSPYREEVTDNEYETQETSEEEKDGSDGSDDERIGLKAGEVEEDQSSGLLAYKSGWITVTQEYVESPEDISSATQSINESPDNKSAYSALYKLVKNNSNSTNFSGANGSNGGGNGGSELHETVDPGSNSSSPSVNGHPNGEKIRTSVKKHRFYAVLKHGNLFLYKNQLLNDVKHVIVLSNQLVTIWPRNLLDGQLFTKYTAICLIKKDWTRSRRLSENFDHERLTVNDILDPSNDLTPPKSSFFIHCDTNIDKEDWYFALIRSSKSEKNQNSKAYDLDLLSNLDPSKYAKTLHFNTNDMIDLIQSLYSSEGNLQTKWFNAILGRIFMALKDTDTLHNYFVEKIIAKLNKIKTPGFLEKFSLNSLSTGKSIPFFTYPNLKEINPNGTVVVSTYVHYHGSMSCNLATKVNISLGGRFQKSLSQSVDVLLKVTLEKLEGPMIFKIKPPPSNRIWYCFEIEPIMNLKIEPIISSRQFTYNILTNSIEKRFKDAIKESLVAPHYDDIVFYHTKDELFRGGIWDKSVRPEFKTTTHEEFDPDEIPKQAPDSANLTKSSASTAASTFESDDKSVKSFDTKSDSISMDTKFDERLKLSHTISDLSKKIKKAKSPHTVSISGSNFLSDGSLIEPTNVTKQNSNSGSEKISNSNNPSGNTIGRTWKKLGDWYTNNSASTNSSSSPDPNATTSSSLQLEYHKPEMILNRRRPRNPSIDKLPNSPLNGPTGFEQDYKLASMSGKSSRKGSNAMSRTSSNSFSSSPMVAQNNSVFNENAFEMFVKPNDYQINAFHSRKNSKLSMSSLESDRLTDLESKSELTFNVNEQANKQANEQASKLSGNSEIDAQIHEELIRLESEASANTAELASQSDGNSSKYSPLMDKFKDLGARDDNKEFKAQEEGSGVFAADKEKQEELNLQQRAFEDSAGEKSSKLHRKSPPPL